MFFIERNRKINEITDLEAFTTARFCKINAMDQTIEGLLPVRVEVSGLVNYRSIEQREYLVYLKPEENGYTVMRTERIK